MQFTALFLPLLAVVVSGYGVGHQQRSSGCAGVVACPGTQKAQVHNSNRRVGSVSAAGGYWWQNNNPFVDAGNRAPSRPSTTGSNKYPSSGSKFPSVGGSFQSTHNKFPSASPSFPSVQQVPVVNSIVGPMGICRPNFICVHWQLCRGGLVILDGTGIIDKSKTRPHGQLSNLESCGEDMVCCGVSPGHTVTSAISTLTTQQAGPFESVAPLVVSSIHDAPVQSAAPTVTKFMPEPSGVHEFSSQGTQQHSSHVEHSALGHVLPTVSLNSTQHSENFSLPKNPPEPYQSLQLLQPPHVQPSFPPAAHSLLDNFNTSASDQHSLHDASVGQDKLEIDIRTNTKIINNEDARVEFIDLTSAHSTKDSPSLIAESTIQHSDKLPTGTLINIPLLMPDEIIHSKTERNKTNDVIIEKLHTHSKLNQPSKSVENIHSVLPLHDKGVAQSDFASNVDVNTSFLHSYLPPNLDQSSHSVSQNNVVPGISSSETESGDILLNKGSQAENDNVIEGNFNSASHSIDISDASTSGTSSIANQIFQVIAPSTAYLPPIADESTSGKTISKPNLLNQTHLISVLQSVFNSSKANATPVELSLNDNQVSSSGGLFSAISPADVRAPAHLLNQQTPSVGDHFGSGSAPQRPSSISQSASSGSYSQPSPATGGGFVAQPVHSTQQDSFGQPSVASSGSYSQPSPATGGGFVAQPAHSIQKDSFDQPSVASSGSYSQPSPATGGGFVAQPVHSTQQDSFGQPSVASSGSYSQPSPATGGGFVAQPAHSTQKDSFGQPSIAVPNFAQSSTTFQQSHSSSPHANFVPKQPAFQKPAPSIPALSVAAKQPAFPSQSVSQTNDYSQPSGGLFSQPSKPDGIYSPPATGGSIPAPGGSFPQSTSQVGSFSRPAPSSSFVNPSSAAGSYSPPRTGGSFSQLSSSGGSYSQPVQGGPGSSFSQPSAGGSFSQQSVVANSPPMAMSNMMAGMMGMNGNPLIPGTCSAGTYCVPRFQCNPYNGFIIMDPLQLQAVWPDAPQVPLLDCFIPAGVLDAGVCCQQSHPIIGPNGQIAD